MNIQVLSDLHLDHHRDMGVGFIKRLDSSDVDILVIAGDLCEAHQLPIILPLLCDKYQGCILYVPGNHEYYGSRFLSVDHLLESLSNQYPKFHALNTEGASCFGQRFWGTTLWFKYNYHAIDIENDLNDFKAIHNFNEHVYERNKEAIALLDQISSDDIVITHHAPSIKSIDPIYDWSPLNSFFVCDMEELILIRKPKIWIHGHMHNSSDYMLGDTRVICNPLGYGNENLGFDNKFMVRI